MLILHYVILCDIRGVRHVALAVIDAMQKRMRNEEEEKAAVPTSVVSANTAHFTLSVPLSLTMLHTVLHLRRPLAWAPHNGLVQVEGGRLIMATAEDDVLAVRKSVTAACL